MIKIALAKYLDFRYDSTNIDKPFGNKVGNIDPYDAKSVQDCFTKIMASDTGPVGDKVREELGTYSTVINGAMVRWFAPGKLINEGYIEHWANNNLRQWDTSVERKGGNADASVDWGAQHFALTNMSSLSAMLAQVVYEFLSKGAIDPKLATAFISIRVSLRLGSGADEIEMLNSDENIEQGERKKRSELDNLSDVFQCIESMKILGKSGLDPSNGVHVFKYMCALHNPKEKQLQPYMKSLLDKKHLPPTLANRLTVMSSSDINHLWLKVNKVTTSHPVLRQYHDVLVRLRFAKGFNPDAFQKLVTDFASEAGRQGLANQESPLTRSLLMDSNLLKSDAFTDSRQAEAVPSYRDGRSGDELQFRMVEDFIQRYFGGRPPTSSPDVLPGTATSIKSKPRETFKSADAWVAYSRLTPVIEKVVAMKFGNAAESWPDAAAKFMREHRVGQYDIDCQKCSAILASQFDSRPADMMQGVEQNFQPLRRMLAGISAADALKHAPQDIQKFSEPKDTEKDGAAKNTDNNEPTLGDVTNEMAKDLCAAGKQSLCIKLNKENKEDVAKQTEGLFLSAAACLWRDKVLVFEGMDAAKSWLETSSTGLKARVQIIDVSMPDSLQTSSGSRVISKMPDESHQKQWAADAKMLPPTNVVGHIMIRGCQHDIHILEGDLSTTHSHKRTITVPIGLPKHFQAKLESAQKRSFGPRDEPQERSGVDLVMRSIGRRAEKSMPTEDDDDMDDKSDDEGADVLQDKLAMPQGHVHPHFVCVRVWMFQ